MNPQILSLSPTESAWLGERLRRNSRQLGDCVIWTGHVGTPGYGRITFPRDDGRRVHTGAHRAAWLIYRGPIADASAVVDHLCRRRDCMNVEHLELVSHVENVRRGAIPNANRERFGYLNGQASKTHCKWGHEFTPENTHIYTYADGHCARVCRTCRRARGREQWAKTHASA